MGPATQLYRVTNEESSFRAPRLARLIMRAPLVLTRRLWVWPLVAALALGLVGFWMRNRLEGTMKAELSARLETLLKADVAALRLWFTEQKYDAQSFAADVRVQEAVAELVAISREGRAGAALANSEAAKNLQVYLKPALETQRYLDYVIVAPDKRILASPRRLMLNRSAPVAYDLFLEKALAGELAVSRPFGRDPRFVQSAEGPTMFVAAPVKATNGTVIAALGLRMKPEAEFSQIFSVARMGESGEAYAFDRRGVMLTASRFDPELKQLGLITNSPLASSVLSLELLDPEVDLEKGEKPAKKRSELKLTRMAAAATRGTGGSDVHGYRNYRGTQVVGAWAWLPEYGMGVATEVAVAEGFETLYVLREVFLVLFALLVLSSGAIFVFTLLVERLRASVRKSTLTVRRLGQYVLVQEIGRGATGMVYRARHTLLRRPVAIKLLSPDMTNEATVARFEQEVQMTSQLTHPNTVAIYDYGRTPEGLFYYAMEYLSGIDLDRLIKGFGPQPEGRVIHILRQVCGSLAEAHRIGLIHRDIKPANILLTRRGGVCDVVKVLDFGVVKAMSTGATAGLSADALVGTPHYIPPEGVEKPESVNGQSDLYSVGAVGYWLLTGKTLFDEENVRALLTYQIRNLPLAPSARLGREVSPDLEELLMRCLAKDPAKRPVSAEALDEALAGCASATTWPVPEAEKWWRANVLGVEVLPTTTMAEKTLVIVPHGDAEA
jgi:tRNA A-37 threonylcarbamoyl transferase component Bud32